MRYCLKKGMGDVKKKPFAFSGIFSVAVVVLALLLFGWISGLRLCAVVSGSMEPNLPTWSLCLVNSKTAYEDVEVGDIVVYYRRSDNLRIIHRVIAVYPEGMETKGDANAISDGVSVDENNLYGKMLGFVPYLGYLTRLTATLPGKAVIVIAIAALIVSDVRDTKKKHDDSEPEESDKTE